MKLQWKRIFLIGLAFFSVSIAWAVYNAYVPIFLAALIPSSTLVGFVMSFDNIAGLVFQPFFGKKSDTTKTRLGRRIPFMAIGIPASAAFLVLIPVHRIAQNRLLQLFLLIVAVVLMNIFMSVYRAPAVALMPDATPAAHRSRANGVINFMGGFGSVAAFLVGGILFKYGEALPFVFAAVMMILALSILLLFYKEPAVPFASENSEQLDDKKGASLFLPKAGKPPLIIQNRNLILMLLSVFLWFCGYNAIETFFTLFCRQKFGMSAGSASQMLTFLALSFLLFAIPAGLIGSRIGRKKTMVVGICVVISMFIMILLVDRVSFLPYALMGAGGGWALININSYPTVVQMAPKGETGKYTGYYYAFAFTASIVSPILFGFIADLMGQNYRLLFQYSLAMFLLALLMLLHVRVPREEAESKTHVLESFGND